MKDEALHHWKMDELMRVLNLPRCFAAGVMESLLKWAKINAIDGGIGKVSNAGIASGIDWREDPDKLIRGLMEAKWVIPDPFNRGHRIVLNDLCEHGDDGFQTKLARRHGFFACCGIAPRLTGLTAPEKPKLKEWYERNSVLVEGKRFAVWAVPGAATDRKLPVVEEIIPEVIEPVVEPPKARESKPAKPAKQRKLVLSAPEPAKPAEPEKQQPVIEFGKEITVRDLRGIEISSKELEAAWYKHQLYSRGKSRDKSIQEIMNELIPTGQFNVAHFRERHPRWCSYWATHGWKWSRLSFMDWIEQGMPFPPEEASVQQPPAKRGSSSPLLDSLIDQAS